MKRADLVVGQEYWYSRNNIGWDENLSGGSKVIVVDVGTWFQPSIGWSRTRPEPRKVAKGLGVLVDMMVKSYNSDEERVERTVVSVTTIKGPYEETKKKIENFMEVHNKRVREAREIGKQRDAEAKEATDLARRFGITVYPRGGGNDTLTITAADLTLLINAVNRDL